MILFFKSQAGSVIAAETMQQAGEETIKKFSWLFGNAELVEGEAMEGFFIGPRREMITPWSTNAVEITQNMGIEGIARI